MKLCGRRKAQSAFREISCPDTLSESLEALLRLHTGHVGGENLLSHLEGAEEAEGVQGPEQECHLGLPLPSYLGAGAGTTGKPSSDPSPQAHALRHRETVIFASK